VPPALLQQIELLHLACSRTLAASVLHSQLLHLLRCCLEFMPALPPASAPVAVLLMLQILERRPAPQRVPLIIEPVKLYDAAERAQLGEGTTSIICRLLLRRRQRHSQCWPWHHCWLLHDTSCLLLPAWPTTLQQAATRLHIRQHRWRTWRCCLCGACQNDNQCLSMTGMKLALLSPVMVYPRITNSHRSWGLTAASMALQVQQHCRSACHCMLRADDARPHA
jgi:hypothetical protein